MADELHNLIPILKESNVKVGMVLRDIIGQPRFEKEIEASFSDALPNIIENMLDGIAILGDKSVHSIAEEFSAFQRCNKLFYCGYVPPVNSVNLKQSENRRANDLFCFVGGGWDADDVLTTSMKCSVKMASTTKAFKASIITGPFCDIKTQLEVYNIKNGHKDIQISAYENNWQKAISSDSIVVCMGGYNTMSEIMYYGVRAICIPRNIERIDNEQLIRSRKFKNIANITTIEQSELTTQLLTETIQDKIDSNSKVVPYHLFDDGSKCVSFIEWLYENE
jgi:predicted glycosyltransferase